MALSYDFREKFQLMGETLVDEYWAEIQQAYPYHPQTHSVQLLVDC